MGCAFYPQKRAQFSAPKCAIFAIKERNIRRKRAQWAAPEVQEKNNYKGQCRSNARVREAHLPRATAGPLF